MMKKKCREKQKKNKKTLKKQNIFYYGYQFITTERAFLATTVKFKTVWQK